MIRARRASSDVIASKPRASGDDPIPSLATPEMRA